VHRLPSFNSDSVGDRWLVSQKVMMGSRKIAQYKVLSTMSVSITEEPITALLLSSATSESIHNLKSWTVQDYHRMSEMGILDPNERTELIDGQITLMVAKGTPHVITLQLLASELLGQLGTTVLIRTQDPIHLDNSSEPEPDLVIVRGEILDYVDRYPQPNDIYLLVEVADSTLNYDCQVKDKTYAKAGIPDYWVVDLKNRQVHVFRNPTPTGYASQLILAESQTVSPLAFPDVIVPIGSILPPV
jgi:Uma2 family endonuclease